MDLKSHIGTIITILTVLVTISITWGSLNTKVEATTEKIKTLVPKSELDIIVGNQDKVNSSIEKRLERIESKIDRISERL